MTQIINWINQVVVAVLHNDLMTLVKLIGAYGVFFIVFAESGLLIGFFLPGDSLLFTAGLLSSPAFGIFNIWHLLIGNLLAAVIGDNVGYEFGKRAGRNLFKREKSLLFNPENVMKAQEFYEKHGGKAIILARFMPVVRTFAPIVAGIGHMDHKRFMFFNFIGGSLWAVGLTALGYFLGNIIPHDEVDKYLLPIILGIVLISVAPPIYHYYKEHNRSLLEIIIEKIKRFFKYQI